MARIYVAGSVREWRRARALIEGLLALGHVITADWTLDAETAEQKHGNPSDANVLDHALRERIAKHCIRGVESADLFILLISAENVSRGAWFEFGLAYTWVADRWIIGSAEQLQASVFTTQALRVFPDEAAALIAANGYI